MMLSNFRKSLSGDESGQAIILGAVSLLVLAVGIMTTAQLGWAIKERIQLQHAADNAAYTSTVMIARSLNFISWTNRAMVAQYLTAMAIQSYSTYVDSIFVIAAQLAATILSAAFLLGTAAVILMATIVLFPLGETLREISIGIGKVGESIKKAVNGLKEARDVFDSFIAAIVKGIRYVNEFGTYWIMQMLAGKGFIYQNFGTTALGGENNVYTSALRFTAGDKVNEGTLGGTGINGYNALMNILGIAEYDSLFDKKGSQKIGKSSLEGVERAEKLMTAIVNGSRVGQKKDDIKWETRREFGAGTIVEGLLGLLGVSDSAAEGVGDILDALFPNSEGGSLLARPLTNKDAKKGLKANTAAEAKNGDDAAYKKNPVFFSGMYQGYVAGGQGVDKLPNGQALISTEFVHAPLDDLPWFIQTAKKYVSKVTGELVPETKIVGIQATKTKNRRIHCKYDDIVAITDDACNGLSSSSSSVDSSAREQCDKICQESCGEGEKIEIELENGTKESINCVTCDSCSDDTGMSEEEACKEALKAASEAVEGVSSAITGGYPAKVTIECDEEPEHEFALTPYVSFNISGYEEGQVKTTKEEYPSFWAAAHKDPIFLGEKTSALGFGEKFKGGKNFNIESIGVVEGVTSKNIGNCDANFGAGCVQGGYNFNHMDGVKFIEPGMHAWARAQVYYHRPGTWSEPPNLFNPYWKAKLSPIAPVLTNKLNALDKLGAIGEFIGNGLTSVITTVISH